MIAVRSAALNSGDALVKLAPQTEAHFPFHDF
jgi:hypothetical protein